MIREHADLEALSNAVADELASIVPHAIAARGEAHLALSGGSTPKRLFQVLAARGREALPWDKIHLWWGDERTVPPAHPDSNYGMTKATLIDPLGLTNVHPMDGGSDNPWAAAAQYEAKLLTDLGSIPTFDFVYLGLGPDGHTASLFPGTQALQSHDHLCVANRVNSPVTKGETIRLTLTARALNSARHIRFLVAGADKAKIVATVLEGPRIPERYPAQLIRTFECTWHIDAAAATELQSN